MRHPHNHDMNIESGAIGIAVAWGMGTAFRGVSGMTKSRFAAGCGSSGFLSIRAAITGVAFLALGGCAVIDGDRSAQPAGTSPAQQKSQQASLPAPADSGTEVFILPEPRPAQGVAALSGPLPSDTSLNGFAQDYAVFQSVLNDASTLKLNTPNQVRHVLQQLRYSEPKRIARGWIAYRALIAARDPAFARGVQARVAAEGRDNVLANLSGRGVYARRIDGAGSATAAVIETIAADNVKMATLSQRFLTAARDFQSKKWGSLTPLPEERTVDTAALEEGRGVFEAIKREFSPVSTAHAASAPLMEQVLAVAARHVIDEQEAQSQLIDSFTANSNSTRCLRWARLNLNQCLAASHFPSEEAWCTGKHGLEDVRACWAKVLPRSARLKAKEE